MVVRSVCLMSTYRETSSRWNWGKSRIRLYDSQLYVYWTGSSVRSVSVSDLTLHRVNWGIKTRNELSSLTELISIYTHTTRWVFWSPWRNLVWVPFLRSFLRPNWLKRGSELLLVPFCFRRKIHHVSWL